MQPTQRLARGWPVRGGGSRWTGRFCGTRTTGTMSSGANRRGRRRARPTQGTSPPNRRHDDQTPLCEEAVRASHARTSREDVVLVSVASAETGSRVAWNRDRPTAIHDKRHLRGAQQLPCDDRARAHNPVLHPALNVVGRRSLEGRCSTRRPRSVAPTHRTLSHPSNRVVPAHAATFVV